MATSNPLADAPREASPSANDMKRRHSEDTEPESSKRARLSPGKSSPTAAAEDGAPITQVDQDEPAPSKPRSTDNDRDARRKSSGLGDDKKRSQRLFGALLGGNLHPISGDRASKRRAEIETRRKAEREKQDAERAEDRRRRLDELDVQRRREQVGVDERDMHTRHRNMLKAANFFQTTVEPKLYYRPWELTDDQEDALDAQYAEAQARIDEELAAFAEKKRSLLGEPDGDTQAEAQDADVTDAAMPDDTVAADEAAPEKEATNEVAEEQVQAKSASEAEDPKADEVPDSDANHTGDTTVPDVLEPDEQDPEQKKGEVEDEGEHVEVGDEDTVIY